MGELPRIRDFDDATYNPFTALKELGGEERVGDFYPELKRLRGESAVFEGDLRAHFGLHPDITMMGLRHVAVLGHYEVKTILLDPAHFSNAIYAHNLGQFFGRSVTTMDAPEHPRFRQLFQKAFMPKMIARWGEEMIPRLIGELLDGFEQRGRAELVNDFTLRFPFHFIHELMGLPEGDREVFQRLAFGQIAITFDTAHGMDAVEKLRLYLTDLIHDRRETPRPDDFISAIATAEIDGERLPDEIVISFFRQLMNAGGDTSYHGFSNILTALLTHPEQLEAVKRDRALIPKAIEEGLRWDCPVPGISRTPVAPVEIAGVRIEPGDHMLVMLSSANRDERAFDRPDTFDIRRGSRTHAAFGYGPHICIGQHLARLEMVTALGALLDRLPRLRIDPDFPLPAVCGLSLRGPRALHVRFD